MFLLTLSIYTEPVQGDSFRQGTRALPNETTWLGFRLRKVLALFLVASLRPPPGQFLGSFEYYANDQVVISALLILPTGKSQRCGL